MLTTAEIKLFLDEDAASEQKRQAQIGQDYYEGRHDILDYRIFYWNADDELVEDDTRSNAKIPHPFFAELVDQAVQLIMSDKEGFVMSDDPRLQGELDAYFNKNKRFKVELSETIAGAQIKGCDYMHAYKGRGDRLEFENADSLGLVEVEGRFADDGKDQIIWKYVDRIDKEGHTQFKVLNIDDENTYFYRQEDDGEIMPDDTVKLNPRPHATYTSNRDGKLYTKPFGFLPFFRLDNNKKKYSHLKTVKALIDDYDLMASSLTNNLVDFDTPIHVIKGFEGNDLDKLQTNLKTKKLIGVTEDGGAEIMTVDVPYQARETKMNLDEKGIYKFGMGLNLAGLKDTNASTNIAIKAAYSLLELRCSKIIDQLELLLMDLVEVVIDEINAKGGTAYQPEDVYIDICPEIMSNAQENAQIELTEAQRRQTVVNTLLSLAANLDGETMMQNICDALDINYEEIKDKLPDLDEADHSVDNARNIASGMIADDGSIDDGGDLIE